MNTKIFNLITENLTEAFNLPKYQDIVIDQHTMVDQLPWTPARYKKFKDAGYGEIDGYEEAVYAMWTAHRDEVLKVIDTLPTHYEFLKNNIHKNR